MTDDLVKGNYESLIYEVRGQKVMLDFDLARLYGVDTKVLKQTVRRNIKRFPSDFMFELTLNEFEFLRSQIVTSKRGGSRYAPMAFTEQGVAMLSGILNSACPKAPISSLCSFKKSVIYNSKLLIL